MKKFHKRIVSFLTATVMMSNLIPLDELANFPIHLPKLPSFSKGATIQANAMAATAFSPGLITFDHASDFVDYCSYYADDSCTVTVGETTMTFANAHQNDVLFLTFGSDDSSTRGTIPSSFIGLGNDNYAFNGEVHLPDNGLGYFKLSTYSAPLFSYVNDSVKILSGSLNMETQTYPEITVQFDRLTDVTGGANIPLFAQHVMDGSGTSANWNVELVSSNSKTYSGVIGDIASNAEVNLTFTNNSGANVVSNASDVGAICGTIQTDATLNLSFSEASSAYSITSSSGNAGGLVGTMNGTSTLNISAIPMASASKSVVSDSAYAGGLVGEITSQATISMASSIPVGGSVTGTNGAGGLFGYYGNVTAGNTFDIKDYSNETSVYGQYCGGLFGVLENKMVSSAANTLTITDTTSSGHATLNVTSGSGDAYDETGYFGGLVGRYTTDSLSNSLELRSLEYSVTSNDSFNAFGGAVGYIDTAAYIKADGINITAGGTDKRSSVSTSLTEYTYFGGLVGVTSASYGDFIDLGDFTLSLASTDTNGFNGGGVVGRFYNGVLRFSGITDMSSAKPAGAFATTNAEGLRYSCYGQLIGYNNNVLAYALGNGADGTAYGSGWTFKRSSGAVADDLGTWGEVVRSIDDSATTNAIYFDSTSTDHTATIAAAKTSMGSADDFVRTALNIQLNQGSGYNCLLFTTGSNTRSDLLGATLTISDSFSLSGTGINGFMRDGCFDITVTEKDGNYIVASNITSSAYGSVGTFTGTLNGGSKTITLATGEKYGYNVTSSSTAEGVGQIYRHSYSGLFSVIGDGTTGTGTVNNITVAGTINVRNAGADGMSIGGIAARSHGNTTLNAVSVTGLTINYHEGAASPNSDDLGKNIGGFIGYVDNHSTDNGTIEIKGVSVASPSIVSTGHHEGWNVSGGAIGKVASTKIIINIGQNSGDKLTVGMTADISGVANVGSNSDSGGLIGYIISKGSYTTRTVNINNLEFNNCTVGNAASLTGGGFLGYAWLNTTTTINGLTVKGTSSINNTIGSNVAKNVGVMCYSATGKWQVNSLTVTAMSMSNGGGTSLGMIVNTAYSGNSGLYLDVLNAGYTLTGTGITLPSSLGVYDEIAAYSASSLLAGGNGAGVVSINMNSARTGTETKITATGTYQNQISRASDTGITAIDSTKYANNKSRYYYNLDKMSSSNGGQNLLLWSVSKYAASNISNEFVSGKGSNTAFGTTLTTTLSGTADLTGLSFYPLKNADTYSIGNLILTFDYSGIYTTAETVSNGDSYIRDPGAANQHYLMHSGLFMNIPTGKTLNISGDLILKGTFLGLNGTSNNVTNAANGYSGVLVSQTMNGSIISGDSSSIKLDDVKPMTTGNATFTGGYMLINNITRESDLVSAPVVNIKNLYSGTYTGTLPVASSLLGAAEGNDLTIKFSHIKLDARTTALSGNSGLNAAYGTSRSIFNDSTLLYSIKTNQTAILEYYYTYAEDWEDGDDSDSLADRFVTYGKEVKDSVEYKENNISLENRYSGATRIYTNPESSAALNSQYNFSTGWLRYVKIAYTEKSDNNTYYRELKVNVEKNGPLNGCGTYNHPYVITDGDPLTVAAKFISSGATSDMQKIRLPITEVDGIANNAKGNRWCNNLLGCAEFELATSGANSGKYVYSYFDKTESTVTNEETAGESDTDSVIETYTVDTENNTITYVKTTISIADGTKTTVIKTVVYKYDTAVTGEAVEVEGGISEDATTWTLSESNGTITKVESSAENGTNTTTTYTIRFTKTWTAENVRLYLANAYYQIGDSTHSSITLSDSFTGLGATEANYAFRGVVVGYKANSSSANVTITNDSDKPFILVSNGSVVKDININVNAGDISRTQSSATYDKAYFGYNSLCQYYGGIIGEIMGGDNIIDNSYVKYSYTDSSSVAHTTTITLSDDNKNKYGTIIPVGGYVGVVVFGGLVFKNMTAANTTASSTGLKVYYKTNTGNNLALDTTAAKTAIYVNPIVGRVINGYAVNETTKFSIDEDGKYQDDNTSKRFDTKNTNNEDINTDLIHTLKNGTKHYTIADVKKSETNKLSVTPPTSATDDGTISIPNSQAFFILSLITQSCAGTVQTANGGYSTSLSYGTNTTVYGMSHIADYSDVGKANITTSNTDYGYASSDTAANTAIPYIIRWYTAADSSGNYPARCVTSTKGYYDINLNAKTTYSVISYTYQLPDSFRGLGSVGNYDSLSSNNGRDNKFSIKLDILNGNGCTIDEDIYMNKFKQDNYMNYLHEGKSQDTSADKQLFLGNKYVPNHGIGLFNSVITKTTTNSGKFTNFTLTGSVNTEIYDNAYKETKQECNYVNTSNKEDGQDNPSLWLSVGGVCGWSTNGVWPGYELINLNNIKVSGADFIGGLLGYSGLQNTSNRIVIKQCSANNISIEMSSSRNIESTEKSRNGMGCFVGKVQEGGVYIYGTSYETANTDLTKYSTVVINSIGFVDDTLEYYTSVGGLVGFAGDGCRVYDMKIQPVEGRTVTIGSNKTRFAGGMVGAMQSQANGGTTGIAYFKNCTVEQININGSFAGGFYGGKWDSNWTTYSITLDNCKLVGSSSEHNTIYGNELYNGIGYAGGFIGRLYPYTNIVKVNNKNTVTHNVLINDCVISNYDITAANTKTSYAGGFIGYANSAKNSVTCYLHDSSIENCKIGASGNYSGGIIGQVAYRKTTETQSNQLLGYNIKLDTITTDSGDNMGAWIGNVNNDTEKNNTSIQFAGMAIYGTGYKNVGNNATLNTASFVFADYTGQSRGEISSVDTQVDDVASDTFVPNESNKTIARTVVTVSGGKTNTQTITYRYDSAVTGSPVSVEDGVEEDSIAWSISESEGKIYKVEANASANTETTTTYTIAVSGYNATNNVTMPKYPFVNINPQDKVGASEIISGDGAVLYGSTISDYSGKTGDLTMAAKIYSELSDTSNTRRYTSFVDSNIATDSGAGVSIDNYMKHTAGTDGDRISTYLTENGSLPSGVENFAVIAITNTDDTETTNLINRYIQLVTNTSTDYTDYSVYYNIDVKTCKYQNGNFEITNDATGITWTAPTTQTTNGVVTQTAKGSFALNGANADSGRTNTFTLIDVQFKDPFHTDDIAYHLYVPVYTIKQMTFGFSAAAMTDTNSVHYPIPNSGSDYEVIMAGSNRLHVDSLKTWVTQYIRFTYTAEDLNILLSGNNVNWNHNKYVTFDTQSNSLKLPDDTYLVLVDPNGDSDKAYYASARDFDSITTGNGGWTIDLTKFNKESGNDNTAFSVSTFNQMIAKAIDEKTPTSGTGKGMYNEVTFEEGHTIISSEYDVFRIDSSGVKHYYRYVGGNGSIDLAVPSTYVLNEDYYISMYVPKVSGYNNELYYYTINSPDLLSGTRSAARTSNSSFNVLVADLYKQTTSYTLGNTQEQITDTNRTISVDATTTIELTNSNAAQYLQNRNLYQAFDILLNCYGEDGSVVNEIAGYDDEHSTATYTIGGGTSVTCNVDRQENYILVNTTDVMSALLGATGYKLTISADIDMVFSDIEAEFPEKTTSNSGIGVNVSATSNLAYDSNRLAYTSMSEPFEDNTLYYYRESVSVSILSYKAVKELDVYDTYGKDSKNYSRLGVNGQTSTGTKNNKTAMLIDSEATLNASAIEDTAHANTKKIRYTLTLNKKTDTKVTNGGVTTITKAEYVKVDNISDYLSNVDVKIGNTSLTKLASSTNSTYVYEATVSPSTNKIYNATTEFYVITGEGFTEYANYQVVLQAELLDGNGETIGNKPTDYLVYTNAKVYPTVIEQTKSNS